jgi:predicted dehydrogenase
MNGEAPTVVLAGIGGYGKVYLDLLRPLQEAARARLVGAIDPFAARAPDFPALAAAGVPVWPDFDRFRAAGVRPDLIVLSSPIQFHCEQSCAALAMGVPVLCEKPAAATVAEIDRMAAAQQAAARLLAIGFQWSFTPAIQSLKADLLAGRYGRPLRFRTWVGWPRTSAYYGRNTWAGRVRDGAGRPVNDSPVSNATAHYLHNMLYLLGDAPERAAAPLQVTAELYRANAIETFDAACLRLSTRAGTEILFLTAHCVDETRQPEFVLECTGGAIRYRRGEAGILGTTRAGEVRDYGNPDAGLACKLTHSLEAAVAGRTDTLCGIDAAGMLTRVIDALQRIPVRPFDVSLVTRREVAPGEGLTCIPGLAGVMQACFAAGCLFSEANVPWAAAAQTVDCQFPGASPSVAV